MYLLKVFGDVGHDVCIREDRYPTVKRLAYFLGHDPSHIYNWMRRRAATKGILKFVEIYKL